MSENSTITYTAADELDRRATPRPHPAAPKTPEGKRLSAMSGDDLRAEAGVEKPVKAPKAKATPKVKAERVVNPHTALRKQAWDYRAEQFKLGNKVTLADAQALFGTTSAAIEQAALAFGLA